MLRIHPIGRGPSMLARWGWAVALCGVALVLAGGEGSSRLAAQAPAKQVAGAALPADLALVPPDAAMFITLRVADLWNGEVGKLVRQHGGKGLAELLEMMNKTLGMGMEDIDRVTMAMQFPQEAGQEPSPFIIVTTTKPYDRQKLVQALAPEGKEQQLKGKTYYTHTTKRGPGLAFFSDRMILVADPPLLVQALEREGSAAAPAPFGAALRLAASGKHHLVQGVNMASLLKEMPRDLPPEMAPFKPLLEAKFLTSTVDFVKGLRMEYHLQFTDADRAREGERAAKAGLDKIRELLSETVLKQVAVELKDQPNLLQLIKDVQTALKNIEVRLQGTDVRVAVHLQTDVGKVVGAILEAVGKVRGAANRMTSTNNLKQIALAMHNYQDAYNRLPAHAIYSKDGKPLLSWRVLLLPYLDEDNLYKQFRLDEPWDSVHNKKLLARMPKMYAPVGRETKEPYTTYYQVFTGKDTLFSGSTRASLATITDGTSNTLLAVEAGEPVPWTKPEDLPYDGKKPLPKLGGLFPHLNGFNAAFCDGSVRFLRNDLMEMVLRALITPYGGEVVEIPDR